MKSLKLLSVRLRLMANIIISPGADSSQLLLSVRPELISAGMSQRNWMCII